MKIEEVIQTLKAKFCQSDEEILLFITSGVKVLQVTHAALLEQGCVISKIYEDEISDQLTSIMKYLDCKVKEVEHALMHEV